MQRVVEHVRRQIDILHNNAAITSVDFMMRDGMIHELDVDLWDQTMAVNVRGYMLCTKHVVPSMLVHGGGVIVNTSSGAGLQGELVRAGVRHVEDGDHRLHAQRRDAVREDGHPLRHGHARDDADVDGRAERPAADPRHDAAAHAHTRARAPGDVADAIVFLASDSARAITGSVIPIDGGFGMHRPSFADEVAMLAAMSGDAEAAQAERFRTALEARGRTTLGTDDVALLAELSAATPSGTARPPSGRRDEIVGRWNELAALGNVEVGDRLRGRRRTSSACSRSRRRRRDGDSRPTCSTSMPRAR